MSILCTGCSMEHLQKDTRNPYRELSKAVLAHAINDALMDPYKFRNQINRDRAMMARGDAWKFFFSTNMPRQEMRKLWFGAAGYEDESRCVTKMRAKLQDNTDFKESGL